MIITVGNIKGGCGKTTIATNLAVLSALSGHRTMLIDCDVQGSSMSWRSCRPDECGHIHCVAINTPTLHKDIRDLDFNTIIIDAGGRDNDLFRSAIMACDKMIVPLTPSPYDVWSSEDTFKILSDARIYKDIPAIVVINQVIPNTNLAKEIIPLLDDLAKDYQFDIAKSTLGARQDFKKCVNEGQGVSEFSPETKADIEIRELYEEVFANELTQKTK